jgi:hypothetical protein
MKSLSPNMGEVFYSIPAQTSINIAINIATNLARSAKYRHFFVAVLHTDCDFPDPARDKASCGLKAHGVRR